MNYMLSNTVTFLSMYKKCTTRDRQTDHRTATSIAPTNKTPTIIKADRFRGLQSFPGWSFSRMRQFLMINLQAHT